MTYSNMTPGTFLSRPNRFIAHVKIDGQVEVVHVKNTGRCRELLPSGAKVWCQKSDNPNRKICVPKPLTAIPVLIFLSLWMENPVFWK